MLRNALVEELFSAINANNTQQAKSIIILLKSQKKCLEEKDKGRDTPLILAVRKNNIECVKALIEAGVNINIQGGLRYTALHWAAFKGYHKCVTILLNAKASPNNQSIGGNTILQSAARANINAQDLKGETALIKAIDHTECVRELIDAKAKLEIVTREGRTALDDAILYANPSAVNLLLEKGAIIRNPRILYRFLRGYIENGKNYDVISALIALNKQQRKLSEDKQELEKNELNYLDKVQQWDELHKKNIAQAIDKGTNEVMPTVLLKMITQYITPKDMGFKNLSIFRTDRIDSTLKKEQKKFLKPSTEKRCRNSSDQAEGIHKKLRLS